MGRGIAVPKFGIFTFSAPDVILEVIFQANWGDSTKEKLFLFIYPFLFLSILNDLGSY